MPRQSMRAVTVRFGLEHLSTVRVAILSDTHGRIDPRIVGAVRRHDCVVHAGDIGAAAVLDQLCTRRGCCIAVRGNNDTGSKWPSADAGVLKSLPDIAWLDLPGGRVAVVHGDRAGRPAQRHAVLRDTFPEARLVVYGHSHRQLIDREKRPWVANPGAAGRTRTFGGPGYLSLSASQSRWRLKRIVFTRE